MLNFTDLNPTITAIEIGFIKPIGPTPSLPAYDILD